MKLYDFLSGLGGRERLLILVVILMVSSMVPFLALGNNIAASIAGVFIVAVVWIASPVWRPPGYGKNKIRWVSIFVVAIVAVPHKYWSQILISGLSQLNLPSWVTGLLSTIPESTPSALVMAFVLAGIFIVNFFMRDDTVMKEAAGSVIGTYSEKELRQELGGLKKRLKTDLDEINSDTSWSSKYYEPLKAQVEIKKGFKKSRKLSDLLTAIKQDSNSEVFLVIGDPGAGKSVALRKLAEDLLDEFESTGKLPLYINFISVPFKTKGCKEISSKRAL